MGLVIANCKGYAHVFSESGSTAGFYEVEPGFEDSNGAKALIMGVALEFSEIVQPTTTLDDKRLLYMFGTAWNDVSISGLLILGDHTTKGAILASLLGWYEKNRVSKLKAPIKVSLGSFGIDAYVVGLSLGQANPAVNTQTFIVRLVTADVKP